MWQRSLLPSSYSVMDMGYPDYGNGPRAMDGMTHGSRGSVAVQALVADPNRKVDVRVNLVARQGRVKLASGRVINGYSINGTTPGPTITAAPGDLVEVHLTNANVKEGVALHWHGIDVPNAEDGVAGVTQDAVLPGHSFTYRFVAEDAGTYWYHSHQVSHRQVLGGMFGAFVVDPRLHTRAPYRPEAIAVAHTYDGVRTLNGREGTVTTSVGGGPDVAHVRIINTDNGTMQVWSGNAYRVEAVDGRDLNQPTWVSGKRLSIPAGGRVDVGVRLPGARSVRVQVGAATALVLQPQGVKAGALPAPAQPTRVLDLLSYGAPKREPLASAKPDRTFTYRIGRRLGFLDGTPGSWWTVNGHLYPDIPMFTVREGDIVKFHIDNRSGESHPMHLHGHHALVVARDGKPATGSPLWVDSIDVANGQTMDLVFRADNPGIWMDHCHNLTHAAEGLVAHLMYEGVTTPYKVGGRTGNRPE